MINNFKSYRDEEGCDMIERSDLIDGTVVVVRRVLLVVTGVVEIKVEKVSNAAFKLAICCDNEKTKTMLEMQR